VPKLARIVATEPVIHGVLKLVFTDRYEGVVDLRPFISQGGVFKWLQKPKNFSKVQLEEYGHHVFWAMTRVARSTSAPTASAVTHKNKPNSTS
jgi:Protein of unknown function (DUF2442)